MTSNTAPGTTVTVTAAPSSSSPTPNTGTFFVVGATAHGPVGVPIQCGSLSDFTTLCGPRESYSSLYDSADMFFRFGALLYVSRTVGPAATSATLALKDSSAATCLNVSAVGPGADGNNLSVAVVTGPTSGTYQLVVYYTTNSVATVVETSPPLITPSDAVSWATPSTPFVVSSSNSNYLSITAGTSSNAPAVVAATALSGGADDNSNITDTIRTTALTAFGSALGPGQVAAPGITTTATYQALAAHAAANNRLAVCDIPNVAASSAVADATAVQTAVIAGTTDPSYSVTVGPWINWPGIPTGTAVPAWGRQVPPSAAFAALCAQNDAQGDANIAAAGNNGILSGAIGLANSYESIRAAFNNAPACVFRVVNGNVELYGWVSNAVDPNWQDLSSVRFRMQLVALAKNIGDNYVFAQIDPQGKTISAFNGDLTNMLQTFNALGSVYAFEVDTGSTVNTPATIAARQLNAAINLQMSPSAPWVNIAITKYLVGAALP